MPTDLPDGFRGTNPPPIDPALISPHRLAAEPQRQPLLAGQPLGIKVMRLVILIGIVGIVLSALAVGVSAAAAAIIWLLG